MTIPRSRRYAPLGRTSTGACEQESDENPGANDGCAAQRDESWDSKNTTQAGPQYLRPSDQP